MRLFDSIKERLGAWHWRFTHWFFQWKKDEDGDIVFVIANCLAFTKYKESTLVNFKGARYRRADKWQGYKEQTRYRSHATWCDGYISLQAVCSCGGIARKGLQ